MVHLTTVHNLAVSVHSQLAAGMRRREHQTIHRIQCPTTLRLLTQITIAQVRLRITHGQLTRTMIARVRLRVITRQILISIKPRRIQTIGRQMPMTSQERMNNPAWLILPMIGKPVWNVALMERIVRLTVRIRQMEIDRLDGRAMLRLTGAQTRSNDGFLIRRAVRRPMWIIMVIYRYASPIQTRPTTSAFFAVQLSDNQEATPLL